MEEEGAVGESEEEEEGAVVDVGVSDSEEELEVLQQPNLIQKLADVVRLRASCVIELEGGAQLTIRPATQRRRPPRTRRCRQRCCSISRRGRGRGHARGLARLFLLCPDPFGEGYLLGFIFTTLFRLFGPTLG